MCIIQQNYFSITSLLWKLTWILWLIGIRRSLWLIGIHRSRCLISTLWLCLLLEWPCQNTKLEMRFITEYSFMHIDGRPSGACLCADGTGHSRTLSVNNSLVLIMFKVFFDFISITRSTRRAPTSLAEADHYSHIFQWNNVEPWWWKAKPKGFGSLPAPRSGYATTIMVFFCSFTHLRTPRSPPQFSQFFIVLPRIPP